METIARSPAFPDRRQRILLAAARLFAESPYDAVRVDEIALAARVAKPTLYRYFATKEALFAEALDQAIVDLSQAVGAICDEPGPAEERLRRAIALVLGRVGRLKGVWRAMESEGMPLDGQSRRMLRRRFRDLSRKFARVLREGQEAGEFAPVDPDLAALLMIGGIRMAASAEGAAGGSPADSIADVFLSGLRRPRARRAGRRPGAIPSAR